MDKRINLLRIFLIVFLITITVAVISNLASKKQPLNLLLISIDTLRPDHMGIYGYPKNTTPNIDRWAKDAAVFTNANTVVPMTQPSFAALMTGRNPFQTRIITNMGLPVSSNTKTLAGVLEEHGYATAAFLTWGELSDNNGLNQGFQEKNKHIYKYFNYDSQNNERYKMGNTKSYEDFILQSTSWLKNNKQSKFFLWVHLMDPHAPYYPPEDVRCKLNQKYCSTILGKTLDELDEQRAQYQMCQDEEVPKDVVERMKTLYDGGVANADRLVGKILKALKKNHLEKNTIVVLYGDHGEGFDHNYYFNHREVLYESSVKIPLIIKYPSTNTNNKRSSLFLDNTDISPTLLDLLNLRPVNPQVNGIKFTQEIKNNLLSNIFSPSQRVFSYAMNSTATKFSVSDGRYKYIYSLPGSCLLGNQLEEFYDLKNDPQEQKNIFSTNSKLAQKFRKRLLEYLSPYNLPVEIPQFLNRSNKTNSNDTSDRLKSLGY